jgi:hypothetical protein
MTRCALRAGGVCVLLVVVAVPPLDRPKNNNRLTLSHTRLSATIGTTVQALDARAETTLTLTGQLTTLLTGTSAGLLDLVDGSRWAA